MTREESLPKPAGFAGLLAPSWDLFALSACWPTSGSFSRLSLPCAEHLLRRCLFLFPLPLGRRLLPRPGLPVTEPRFTTCSGACKPTGLRLKVEVSMPLRITCPHCHGDLRLPEHLYGGPAQCPRCGGAFAVEWTSRSRQQMSV